MYNNFLVSGYGRSGTKFLYTVLSKVAGWEVHHEPNPRISTENNEAFLDGAGQWQVPDVIQQRFLKQNYGEVNSYLRYHFYSINVARKAIVLRNPQTLVLSMMNRRDQFFWEELKRIKNYYFLVHASYLAGAHIPLICFETMVSDEGYLNGLASYLLDADITLSSSTIEQVNQTVNKRFKQFEDLPVDVQTFTNSIPYEPTFLSEFRKGK